MRLSAVDSVRRGLVNLRANWELIGCQLLQVFLVSLLVLVGLAPPLAVLGWPGSELWGPSAADWSAVMDSVAGLIARGREAWALLLASLALTFVIWLMAMLVYCYFQAGIFGVLVAGDRQAPAGRPRVRQWFRTFSAMNFRGWAGRYLWRYFWLLNLFVALMTLWLSIPALLLGLTVWGESRWGPPAAVGIGCGGVLPVAFSLLVLVFWSQLAQADLARPRSGIWSATRRGLQVLGRRLGTVFVLAVALLLVILSLTVTVAMLSVLVDLVAGQASASRWIGQTVLTLFEWIVSSLVSVASAAIFVALIRSESPLGATV